MFDEQELMQLMHSDEVAFRKIGCKNVVDDFHEHWRLFFDGIAESKELRNILVYYAKKRFCFLKGMFSDDIRFESNQKYVFFERQAEEQRLFVSRLHEYLKSVADIDEYFDKIQDLSAFLKPYLGLKNNRNTTSGNRQLMLFITGLCNLRCDYCFSENILRKEMNLVEIRQILNWCKSNGIGKVSLCGGEPTSHSQFNDILKTLYELGLTTYFASNLTNDLHGFDAINYDVVKKVFAHITEVTYQNKELKKIFTQNIDFLRYKGIATNLRVNIYDKNHDVAQWIDFANELEINAINVALTFPVKEKNNTFVAVDKMRDFAEIISEYVDRAASNNIVLDFAKPMPLCIFDDKLADKLLRDYGGSTNCSIAFNNYTNNVAINTDGYVYQCMGLTKRKTKFDNSLQWADIERFCSDNVRKLMEKPLTDRCDSCFLFDARMCQGACLSYKDNES